MAPAFLALNRHDILRRGALAAVLLLAAALRLHRLPEQGLLLFDEGFLVREARSVKTIAGGLAGGAGAKQTLVEGVKSSPLLFAKPAHNIALAAALSVEPRADRATLKLSAAAGILAVWATFLLGQALFGWDAGILSALILAVSPYHLLYSRSGLSDSLTILFWTVALWTWLRGGKYSAVLSGIAGGICVATNYRELFIPFLFLLLAIRESGRHNISAGAAKFSLWLGGFLAVLLAFELPYQVAQSASGTSFPNGTYIGQLGTLLAFHGSQGFRFSGWPAFFRYMAGWEGWLSLAWLAGACAFQFRSWRAGDALLNAALLLPWLLFSAYWDNASRFFSILLPAVALIKGRWLAEACGFLKNKTGLVPAAMLGTSAFLCVLPQVWPMISRQSPYISAVKLLSDHDSPRHYSTNPWIGDAILGPESATFYPVDRRKLDGKDGIRFAVTDLQALFGGFSRPEERYRTAGWVSKNHALVLAVPYTPLELSLYIFEQDMDYLGAVAMLNDLREVRPALKVFDLAKPASK